MDPTSIGIAGIAALLLLLALGVHIALALATVGFVGAVLILGLVPALWQTTALVYTTVAKQAYIVIPLFIMMGIMAGAGGISRNLYTVLKMWVGNVRGGLGVATVFSCMAFGVVTGSSLVCAAVFSKVSAPEMRRHGYDKKMAYGICSAAGSIGMLIPPSILIVVYAILADMSVGRLLIAGISPGVLLTIAFSVGIIAISYLRPESVGLRRKGAQPITGGSVDDAVSPKSAERVTWAQRFLSLRLIWPILICGLVIVGGMFVGLFSPSEAAAFGAAVIILVNLLTTGRDRWSIMRSGLKETITITGMVFFILFGAAQFSRFLMLSGITPAALKWISEAGLSPLMFVVLIVIVYLILGCFMDSLSMCSITLPVVIPVARTMGIDLMWLAVVSILAIEVGLLTPPVGLNVYAAKGVAEPDVSLEEVFSGSMPFFFMMLTVLVLLILFPPLSTTLPALMMGK